MPDNYLEGPYLDGPYLAGEDALSVGMQANIQINTSTALGMQANKSIGAGPADLGMEVFLSPDLQHLNKGGYLVAPYGETSYLATRMCALQGHQASIFTDQGDLILGMQSDIHVDDTLILGSQAQMVIDDLVDMGMQALLISGEILGMQVTKVLYNVTNVRILCEFDSRGTSDSNNWSATSTAAGDFSTLNLNSDIVEKVWRSTGLVGQILVSDTGVVQGVSPDTFALLNHNLTTGATVVVQGSNDVSFGTVEVEFNWAVELDNMYFLTPLADFPYTQSRYWRISMDDVSNSDGYIEVGTIIFGSSTIFQGDCITDRIRLSTRHFKDAVPTEGFTNVSNDRAIKRAVGFRFKNINFGLGNYNNIREIFESARTSLKCLWIPDPRNPSRFAAFAKLEQIPDEQHNVKGDANEDLDFVSFDVKVDESL